MPWSIIGSWLCCLVACVLGGSAWCATDTPADDHADVRSSTTWSFSDPHQFWRADGTCTARLENGLELVHSTGDDPYLWSPDFHTEIDRGVVHVRVRMKSTSAGFGQFFWWGGGRDISEATSVRFTLQHDGLWHEYEQLLPATGLLQGLRFDPSTAIGDLAISWIRLTITAKPMAALPVAVSGVLLDANGVAVNEGLVLLRGNPQLSALSGADGRFRISGAAWTLPDMLWASAAGSALSEIPLTQAQPGPLTIHLVPQDPTLTRIEMGASLKLRWFPPYTASRPLSPAQRTCLAACDTFLASRGNALIERMLSGQALAPADQPFEYLLAALIWTRTGNLPWVESGGSPPERYCSQAMASFYRVAHALIDREPITPEDLHALRLGCAVAGATGFDATGINFYHGMGFALPSADSGGHLPFDISFIRTIPLLTAPGWSDLTSLGATGFLRTEGLWSVLDACWKWHSHGTSLVASPPGEWREHYQQPGYQVTSANALAAAANAQGKVVFINCANFEDATHPGFYIRQTEYLRRAYRAHVDVYYASQATSDAFVDISMDEWSVFGPNPRADPLLGLDCPRWEERSFTPLRHARIDKLCLMRTPFASGEILQDLNRDGSFLDNRVALHHNVILDRDGTVSQPYAGADWNALPSQFTNFFKDNTAYCTYQRMGGESYWYSLVNEQVLRALIANDGRFAPNESFVPGLYDRILLQYPRTFFAKDDLFEVTAVDAAHGIIRAGWIDPGGLRARANFFGRGTRNWTGRPTGEFRFRCSATTRYAQRTVAGSTTMAPWEEGEPPASSYRLVGLEALHPGDRFFATIRLPDQPTPDATISSLMSDDKVLRQAGTAFDMGRYQGTELQLLRTANYTLMNMYGGLHPAFMPLYGHITAKQGDQITVVISQDDVREMWGYRFWKQQLSSGMPMAALPRLFMPTLMRWADGSDEDRTYRFRIDAATDTFRNGLLADASALNIGDTVFIEFEMWWETQHLSHEIIFPERIQASDPVIAAYVPPLVRELQRQGLHGSTKELLATLRTPPASLLPALLGALGAPDTIAREHAVAALCLMRDTHGLDPASVGVQLDQAIAADHIPAETAFRWRMQFAPHPSSFLHDVLMIGPFADDDRGSLPLETLFAPEGEGILPLQHYASDGRTLAWRPCVASGDIIHGAIATQATRPSVVYAATWIRVERPVRMAIAIGSSGGFRVLVNHQLIVHDPRHRQLSPAQDLLFANLNAGWNEVLVKDEVSSGDWGLCLQFYGMDASPLQAVFAAAKPGA